MTYINKEYFNQLQVPAQKSIDDELIIESDEEGDLPIPDELKGLFFVVFPWEVSV